jgi:hypothetical protein
MLVRCAQLSIKAQRLVLAIWILLTAAGVGQSVTLKMLKKSNREGYLFARYCVDHHLATTTSFSASTN